MTVVANVKPPLVVAQKAMAGHDYKNPGLLRAGFQYQDLVAVEILINFYRQRCLYDWVQLEAEERAFRSIEDVVACRPGGLYELTQVKFTADPDDPSNKLSWVWLTENGGVRRKSLLQKWAETTLHHKEVGNLAQAALKTDRVPDIAFAKCLEGTKVDYTRLSAKDKAKVEEQLGSLEAVRSFFESFEFIHSLPRLDDLEEKLWSRIASDTDRGGWALFREQVQRWSTRKRQPDPDGKIKYIHLRQAFSVERSKPIPQGFLVPSTYSVPDADFDRAFLEEITGSDGLTVLWGPPGRGKSTYLSHCVAGIDRKSAVCIRHHYFLSLEDHSEGRFHYHAIARSLEHQLEEAIPDLQGSRKDFGELLESVALRLQGEGRRLIVVIDGLDHVWRDHRDHEDMEVLFNALLPLPTNVRLVVGTQKIASKHLPARLLNALPVEHWTELPLMSQTAVHRWLRSQDKAGRLNLIVTGRQPRGQMVRAVARAFHEISQGLPLHLIYSFEAIARAGNAVTTEEVAALPACPTGDIRDYYRSFWERMDAKAQAVLHVLAGLEFGPPPFAMQDCFGRSNESLAALAEINHLLDCREMEVRPFHGSLYAFVRDLSEHESTFAARARDVLVWLERDAPEYWRWAWLWITKAQLDNASDLLAGPNREWAISSLVAGFPIEQLITILDHAEEAAFDSMDLPCLLGLRSLKRRAINGPEFQTDEWPLFQEVAVSLSEDPYVRSLLRTELHRVPAGLLTFVVRNADESIRADVSRDAITELNRRIARRHDNETSSSDRQTELSHAVVSVVANNKCENAKRVFAYVKRVGYADALIATYVEKSLLVFNFDNVFAAGKRWSGPRLDRDVLAALCLEGLAPVMKPELKALAHPAIRCLALLKGGGATRRSRTKKDLSRLFVGGDDPDAMIAAEMPVVLYEAFFAALAAGLSGGKAQGWSKIPEDSLATWLREAVRELERLAGGIAEGWKASGRWPTLQDVYSAFNLERPTTRSHQTRSHFIAIRLALRDVAVDLCTIARGLDANARIDVGNIASASKSPFWLDELWLDAFSERRLPLHTPEAAEAFVQRMGCWLDTRITEFLERTTAAAKLAMFASDNSLVPLAQKELRRAVGCLLGYGWRKDMFALEVLESLDLLSKSGDVDARKSLLDLAGEFEAITDYTDGDETDYIRDKYYKVVVAHFPERTPACYAQLIRDEKWRYAEALAIAFVETDQVESRTGRALLKTYIVPSEVRALGETSSAARTHTKAALASVLRKTGRAFEAMPEQMETMAVGNPNSIGDESESEETEVSVPDPSAFPPKRLQEYLSAVGDVRSYDRKRKLATEWLRYWEVARLTDEALTELEAAISKTKYHLDFDHTLDIAFEIALKAQGRSKALPWAIRAHVARSGWQRGFTSIDETQARMKAVAQHYPGQWREFIKKTAKPKFATKVEGNNIVIGLSYLVYFLIEVGELDLARAYTLKMARVFKDELTEQPIEKPEWSR